MALHLQAVLSTFHIASFIFSRPFNPLAAKKRKSSVLFPLLSISNELLQVDIVDRFAPLRRTQQGNDCPPFTRAKEVIIVV
jgi:hypothetical protein